MDQEQQSTSGWTKVGRSKGRKHGSADTPYSPPKWLAPEARDMTAERVRKDFDAKMRIWRASSCRKQVFQILDRQRPDEGWKISQAICLGSGSFSRENLENRRRSVWQFVAFMDIVQYVQREGNEKVMIVAQEPVYTAMDEEFLASMGVEMCHTTAPLGVGDGGKQPQLSRVWDYFGPHSFVCELFVERQEEFLQYVLDAEVRLVLSSMLTAREWTKQVQRKFTSKESHPDDGKKGISCGEILSRDYQAYRFPRFDEDPNTFEGLAVFSRKHAEDDDEVS